MPRSCLRQRTQIPRCMQNVIGFTRRPNISNEKGEKSEDRVLYKKSLRLTAAELRFDLNIVEKLEKRGFF